MITPAENKRAYVTHLESTMGMFIAPEALARREALKYVILLQCVPRHDDDVWWCRHEGTDTVAPYSIWELEEVPPYTEPGRLPKL